MLHVALEQCAGAFHCSTRRPLVVLQVAAVVSAGWRLEAVVGSRVLWLADLRTKQAGRMYLFQQSCVTRA